MSAKRPTVIDLALAAGVTAGTVSRALAGDKRVKPDTRQRILQAAKTLGYRPNQAARSLQAGKTNLIGMFCEEGDWIFFSPYFGQIIAGISQGAEADGNHLVFYLPRVKADLKIAPTHWDVHLTGLDELRDGRVAGGFILGGEIPHADELKQLQDTGMPLLLVSPDETPDGLSLLGSGVAERTEIMLSKVIQKGHRKIGFIGLHRDSAHNRVSHAAWRDILKKNKLKYAAETYQAFDGWNVHDEAETRRVLIKLLNQGVTAIVCAVWLQAYVVMEIAENMGLNIPQDLSLVTAGPMAPGVARRSPALSHVSADLQEEGRQAYKMYRGLAKKKGLKKRIIRWVWQKGGKTLGIAPK